MLVRFAGSLDLCWCFVLFCFFKWYDIVLVRLNLAGVILIFMLLVCCCLCHHHLECLPQSLCWSGYRESRVLCFKSGGDWPGCSDVFSLEIISGSLWWSD